MESGSGIPVWEIEILEVVKNGEESDQNRILVPQFNGGFTKNLKKGFTFFYAHMKSQRFAIVNFLFIYLWFLNKTNFQSSGGD